MFKIKYISCKNVTVGSYYLGNTETQIENGFSKPIKLQSAKDTPLQDLCVFCLMLNANFYFKLKLPWLDDIQLP